MLGVCVKGLGKTCMRPGDGRARDRTSARVGTLLGRICVSLTRGVHKLRFHVSLRGNTDMIEYILNQET